MPNYNKKVMVATGRTRFSQIKPKDVQRCMFPLFVDVHFSSSMYSPDTNFSSGISLPVVIALRIAPPHGDLICQKDALCSNDLCSHKTCSGTYLEIMPNSCSEVMPNSCSEVMPNSCSEVMPKSCSEVMPNHALM